MPSNDHQNVSGETDGGTSEPIIDPSTNHSQGPHQDAPFLTPQSRCHSLLSKILGDAERWPLVCELSEDAAQFMADYLDIVARDVNILSARGRRRALALLYKLTKYAQVFPQCYQLKEVETRGQLVRWGGYADIYKEKYGAQTVCIKVFRAHESFIRTCAPELILWAHLQHKNILPFYGVCLLGAAPCLVSPWMEKGNIRDYLKQFPEKHRMPFIFDILDGLSHLHDLQVVHSDLKAENVLVSDDERALITDFGLSSISANSQQFFASWNGGTPRWMAPELLTADSEVQTTNFCDVWSFACLCYEILTNKVPFYQYNDYQLGSAMARKEIPLEPESDTAASHRGINSRLWALLVKCWNYIPGDRPTCAMLQGSMAAVKIRDDRLRAAVGVEAGSTFRERSSVVDYVRMEEILLQISTSSHSAFTPAKNNVESLLEPEPRLKNLPGKLPVATEGGPALHVERSFTLPTFAESMQGSKDYSPPQLKPRSAEETLWPSDLPPSLPPDDNPSKNVSLEGVGGGSPSHPEKRTFHLSLPAKQEEKTRFTTISNGTHSEAIRRPKSRASGQGRTSTKISDSRNDRSSIFTSMFGSLFRKSAPRDLPSHASGSVDPSVSIIEKEALKPEDYIIVVMGPTGAGRSTFISTATGRDNGVGHGLQSATSQVSAVRISSPGAADVVLVDTPGFADTYTSDLQILKLASDWLQDTYKNGIILSGILYLHRISDNPMAGTPLKNASMFKKLCGEDGFRKVALVTTMWQDVDEDFGLARQTGLQCDYWAGMVKGGSKIMRFDGTRASAWSILDPLIEREFDKRSIRIQKELVDLRKDLPDTAAGQQLYGLIEKLVEKQKDVLGRMREELKNTTDSAIMDAPGAELNELRKERERAMADMRQLDSSMIGRLQRLFRH